MSRANSILSKLNSISENKIPGNYSSGMDVDGFSEKDPGMSHLPTLCSKDRNVMIIANIGDYADDKLFTAVPDVGDFLEGVEDAENFDDLDAALRFLKPAKPIFSINGLKKFKAAAGA